MKYSFKSRKPELFHYIIVGLVVVETGESKSTIFIEICQYFSNRHKLRLSMLAAIRVLDTELVLVLSVTI